MLDLRAPIALLVLALAAWAQAQKPAAPAAIDWELRAPQPVSDERTNELPRWSEVSCARCHADQTREWASSRHALAWVNERYREELLDKKRPEGCYGCHIPKALHPQELPNKPLARELTASEESAALFVDDDPHFGVSCASCHAGSEGEILGPFGAPTDAHRSLKSESFLPEGKSRLCIACHSTNIGPVIGIAKEFVDTQQWEKGKSCVGCHMERLERPIAREPGAREPEKPAPTIRTGRSHALQTPRDPAFLRRALRVSARQEAGAVIVAIENECGHRIPGLVERELEISAELLDASGAPLAQASTQITVRNHLAADGRIELALAGRGPRVRIKGLHKAPGFAEPVTFANEVLDVVP